MREIKKRANGEPVAVERGELQKELQDAAEKNAASQGNDRHAESAMEKNRAGDHRNIEEYRGDCGGEKVPHRIEYPHAEGDETDEEDIGEHETVEKHRKLRLGDDFPAGETEWRFMGETGKHEMNDLRGKDDTEDGHQGHDDGQHGE